MNAMTQVPLDSPLAKAWTAYQATEDFANSFYWATTDNRMRPERAEETGLDPLHNRATYEVKHERVKGSLWAAFMRGFGDAAPYWRSMDTAPKDGTAVLLWWPECKLDADDNLTDEIIGGTVVIGNYVGSWQEHGGLEGRGAYFGDDSEPGHEPSHWMPLPEPASAQHKG